jgi:hypothetical protein
MLRRELPETRRLHQNRRSLGNSFMKTIYFATLKNCYMGTEIYYVTLGKT